MPLVVKDRVLETTSSTGTGTITLGGAVAGYQSFSVIGNGNTTYYSIVGGTEWEVGLGTYTSSGTTLSRDTVLESSNGNALVNFSAGTKNVFVTYPAEKAVYKDANDVFSEFPSGTSMLFAQTAAPTGWTKSTTHNDKALRVVSGTASSGGSVAFSTAFASQSVSGTVGSTTATGSISSTTATNQSTTATGSVSLSLTAGTLAVDIGTLASSAVTLTTTQIPSHTHSPQVLTSRYGSTQSTAAGYSRDGQSQAYTPPDVSSTGGGSSHTHTLTGSPSLSGSPSGTASFTGTSHTHTQDAHSHTFTGTSHNHTFTGTAINLAVQYVDVIIATKD